MIHDNDPGLCWWTLMSSQRPLDEGDRGSWARKTDNVTVTGAFRVKA